MLIAEDTLCPFARCFINKGPTTHADRFCKGCECALFRWEKITTTSPGYREAVQLKAKELDDKPPYPKAARYVADNLAEFGLVPKRGYCGAGGEP